MAGNENVVPVGKPKRNLVLDPSRMDLVEQLRNDWVATVEIGTTAEDIMDPGFFAHRARLLHQYDHIEVRTDDGSWIAELVVTDCGQNWATVHMKQLYKLTSTDKSASTAASKYEVKHRGPHLKWCVIRKSDSEAVQEKMPSEEAAQQWLRNHERATQVV